VTDEQKKETESLEASALGGKISIPAKWGQYIGPYLKWPIMAFAGGLIFYMVCAGIKMVIK
jgi:hypothetical protein